MKKLIIISLFLSLSTLPALTSDKTDLKWYKLDQGLVEAKKANKKILLDIYTDWCKWCKKLDEEVYNNAQVAEYLDQKYITVKLNAESNEEIDYQDKILTEAKVARIFKVHSYPTIIFLDSDGKEIDRLNGFLPAERFLPVIQYFGDDYYKYMSWQEFISNNGSDRK